jgi:hypothetical protein
MEGADISGDLLSGRAPSESSALIWGLCPHCPRAMCKLKPLILGNKLLFQKEDSEIFLKGCFWW